MVRILVEGMTKGKGGKEAYIYNTFKAFDRNEYSFSFIAYDDELAYEKELVQLGATIIHVPPRHRGLIAFRRAVKNLFVSEKYDVVWSHKTTLSSCEVLEYAKKYEVPMRIIHSHSSENMGGKMTYVLHSINKKRISKWATDFFACSEVAAKWFYTKESYSLMKNGIDVKKFQFNQKKRNQVRKELGLGEDFVIGHVGRFGVEKNHIKLLSVFKELLKKRNDAKLVLCGDGEERSNIEAFVRENDLTERVLLLGNINNVHEVLQAIDVFVMPSLFEGLPFALLEAQASGLKCVVSDTVSKESDVMGWNIFLPLSLSDEEWAASILAVGNNYQREMAAAKLVNEGYDISDCAERIMSLIETKREKSSEAR